MLNSIYAAQHPHNFIYRNWEVDTTGNPLTHAVLRGAVNKHGNCIPNYHYEDLKLLQEKYEERNLKNPAVIVDANHSNSNKQYLEQIRIVKEVLHSRNLNDDLKKLVKRRDDRELPGNREARRSALKIMSMENPLQIPALDGMSPKNCCIPFTKCAADF